MQQEIRNTLEVLRKELEAIRAKQNNQNQMHVSLNTDAMVELNCIKQKTEDRQMFSQGKVSQSKV